MSNKNKNKNEAEVEQCPVEDRRIDGCPFIQQVADDAAKKAVANVFKIFDYDMNDKDDRRKVRKMLEFLEALSENVGMGKKIFGKLFVKLLAGTIFVAIATGLSLKWIVPLFTIIKKGTP